MNELTRKDIKTNTDLLIQASGTGDFGEVQRLIPISNPMKNHSHALQMAVRNEHIECIKLLIPVSNPKANNSEALQLAAMKGYIDIVKLLIPVSNPKANGSAALRLAADCNHIEMVQLLLPLSNPKAYNSEALRRAAFDWHPDVVKLLIPVSDCNTVVQQMQKDRCDTTLLQQFIEEYEVQQQKEHLTATVDHISQQSNKPIVKRKM